jgi:hypothetical protein
MLKKFKIVIYHLLHTLFGQCHSGGSTKCCIRTRFHLGKHRAFTGERW